MDFVNKLFEGRINRRSYLIACLIIWAFYMFIVGDVDVDITSFGRSPLAFLISIVLAVPMWSVMARRIHDIGYSGWYVLLGLIPVIGALVGIVLLFLPGQSKKNQYGLVPKPTIDILPKG